MNFNQLRYIVAVDRHRNFNKAADECEVAQSTLSKEIQRLEKEFKVIIFDRSKHPVAPTMKGEDLIKQAQKILEERDSFIGIARKRQNKPSGNFKLGILPMLAPYLLPLFIENISRKYPELKLDVQERSPKEILALFEEDRLDGAIAIRPFIKQGYYEEDLFKEDFVLYIHPEHPLANRKEISWSEIPTKELILHDSIKRYIFSSDEIKSLTTFHSDQISNVSYASGSLETIRKIIDRNGGMTVLPQLSTLYMGERRLKMIRPIVSPTLTRTITLVTPRGFEKTESLR